MQVVDRETVSEKEMNPQEGRRIATTSLEVTQLGLGGTAFGNMYEVLSDEEARSTVDAAFSAGVRYFDTAPHYGRGFSEIRLGAGLAGYDRDDFVLSTKVGYTLEPRPQDQIKKGPFAETLPFEAVFDFSRDGVLRSYEESLKRLGTDRIDILFIHDPDEAVTISEPGSDLYAKSHFPEVMEQVYPALDELRSQGAVRALGLGMNQWQMLYDFALAGDFDCFLLAGRYTLLEQESLGKLLPVCEERKISIVIGGPYNSGILATGAIDGAYYNYAPAPPDILERTRNIEAVCARHDVSLRSAALQFPFGHPTVVSVIPGARSVAEVATNSDLFRQEIPTDFWEELRDLSLIDPDAPLPKGK